MIALTGCGSGGGTSPSSNIPAVNQPPVIVNDQFTAVVDQSLTLPLSQLLQNDSDPDGDVLRVIDVAASSVNDASIRNNGTSWTYQPPDGFTGDDLFSYTVSDGTNQVSGEISIQVVAGLHPSYGLC